MSNIRLTEFSGLQPRRSQRLLANNGATVAANVSLTSGEIRPLSAPKIVSEPTKGVMLETIYLADTVWFTWPYDVDVARSPLPGERRFVYTGDGEPRITTVALATTGQNNDYPTVARPLGFPAPKTAPTVTPSNTGTGVTISRIYTYTFFDDWGQESAPAPVSALTSGKSDDTWALSAMDTEPSNGDTGTVSVTGSVGEEITTFTNAASAVHWLRPGDQVYLGTGTPNQLVTVATTPSATTFTVAGDYTGVTDWERVAKWNDAAGGLKMRIYRTAGTLSSFQLVAEISPSATYNDTLTDAQIAGDDLISGDWALPPTDLKGVITLPSGALAGFSGNELCFSEPFQLHAWPTRYRLRSTWPIVGVESYQSGLVAGTNGNPLLVIGLDPGDMRAEPVEGVYPCLSKKSVISLVDAVAFASESGFVQIGDGGVDVLTKDWFTRTEWAAYEPSTMIAAAVRGRIYIRPQPGVTQDLMIFDFLDGTGLTFGSYPISALFADPISGKLYLSCTCQDDGNNYDYDVREWDPVGGTFMVANWKSKQFVVDKGVNLGAFKVNFFARFTQDQVDALQAEYDAAVAANVTLVSTGQINGSLNSFAINSNFVGGSDLTPALPPSVEAPGVDLLIFKGDDELIYSRFIGVPGRVFRLPSGFKSDRFAVRVQGQVIVHSIELAQTPSSLGAI